ncbi:MAG: c-type cytochrome [Blastocatellia bacterium]
MSARQIQRLVALVGLVMLATLSSTSAFDAEQKTTAIDAEKIFMHECKDCHGEDGRGRMHGQPDFTNASWQANVTDELIFKTIKFGREPMPFYLDALSDDEINALVKYIRSLAQGKPSGESSKPAQAGDVKPPAAPSASTNACMVCHQRSSDESSKLFAHSVHARRRLTCDACHGGDAKAQDQQAAHARNFIGKPSPVEQVTMCGACHTQASADFRTSLHFPKNFEVPRVTCSDCHGAHTVGSASRDFSFAVFCTNCHGLEYLPELPASLRGLLQIADEENRAVARYRAWGREPSGELIRTRREVRHRISDLVHKTDLPHVAERAPEIIQLDSAFKRLLEAEKK